MEVLSQIASRSQLVAPQYNAESLLVTTSTLQLSDYDVETLGEWMKLTQARYPNQELAPGTADMYLAEWLEMAGRYTMALFMRALQRTIRDRSRGPFFPTPEELDAWCRSICREERERTEAKKHLDQLAEWKAQCERERAEDAGKPKPEPTETEKRLDALLSVARARTEPRKISYSPPEGHDPWAIAQRVKAEMATASS